jgi:hypothetical protein
MYPIKDWPKLKRTLRFKQIYPKGFGALTGKPHLGLDIIIPIGTEIVMPFDGTVKQLVGAEGGNTLHVSTQGVLIRFLHLDRFGKKGIVKKGEVIGWSGNTGVSTGPHTHCDISRGQLQLNNINNFIDPDAFDWQPNKEEPVNNEEIYRNIFIGVFERWPNEEELKEYRKLAAQGLQPYTVAQQLFIHELKQQSDEVMAHMIYDYEFDLLKGSFPQGNDFDFVKNWAAQHGKSLLDSVNPAFREQYYNELHESEAIRIMLQKSQDDVTQLQKKFGSLQEEHNLLLSDIEAHKEDLDNYQEKIKNLVDHYEKEIRLRDEAIAKLGQQIKISGQTPVASAPETALIRWFRRFFGK